MKNFYQKTQSRRSQAVQNAVKMSSVQIPLKITLVYITLKKQGCLGCRFLSLTSRGIASQSTVRLYRTLCSALMKGTAAGGAPPGGGRLFPDPSPSTKGILTPVHHPCCVPVEQYLLMNEPLSQNYFGVSTAGWEPTHFPCLLKGAILFVNVLLFNFFYISV